MNKAFEKILERLEEHFDCTDNRDMRLAYHHAIKIVKQVAQEYNNGWIPCSLRLPKEHDSIFAKFKGTDKWKDGMFEKCSDEVNVTVVDKKGNRTTTHACTIDGKWSCDLIKANKLYSIVAWQPLPEPYHQEG